SRSRASRSARCSSPTSSATSSAASATPGAARRAPLSCTAASTAQPAVTSPPATTAAARTPRLFWEDFPVGQVREFGAYRVTREAVLAFARQFDPQPFHLDDAAAEASLFGRLAASGWHTCAIAMRL